MKENIVLKNSVKIHQIKDDKFQSVYASLKIVFKMKAFQNTTANLLAQMMSDRLTTNPSKASIAQRLDMLYGAKIGSTTYSMGSYQVIDLSVVAIAEHFVDTDLFQEQLNLLADMLYEPLLNEETFSEALKNMRLNHSRIKENPSQYAIVEAFKSAGAGQTFSLTALGNLEDLDSVTLQDVKDLHQLCINDFNKEIYTVGPIPDNADYTRFEIGNSASVSDALLKTNITPATEEVMYRGKQTELVLVFETDITPLSEDYAAYLVYIAHLGQLPSSLLFQVVREQHSLCYSIYSSRQIFDGIFYIATGVNDSNKDKALDLINEQIEIMKTDVHDVSAARQYLIMQMEGVNENQKSYTSHIFRNAMLGIENSVEEIQEAIAKVSAEDVQCVAKSVKPGFVYAYRGEHNEEN